MMKLKPLGISSLCLCVTVLNTMAQNGTEVPSVGSSTLDSDWMQWKMFRFRPSVSTTVLYNDNLDLAQTNPKEDLAWYISPGISINAGEGEGRNLSLEYRPIIRRFLEHTENNAFDQAFSLRGTWPFTKLVVGATVQFDVLSTPLTYVGTRSNRKVYDVGVSAEYELSPKTSFVVRGNHNNTIFSDDLIGTSGYFLDNSINYQISPKLNLGLGANVGIEQPDQGGDRTSQELSLRASYQVAAKLDLNLSVGNSWQQYENTDGSTASPVFSLSATYAPFSSTSITLEGHRNNEVSPTSAGVNYYTTGFGITIRQQLWQDFTASLATSYDNLEYQANGSSGTLRTDNSYMIELGLDVRISQHWSAGIFALHRESSSDSAGGVAFNNNQVGLQTSYSF